MAYAEVRGCGDPDYLVVGEGLVLKVDDVCADHVEERAVVAHNHQGLVAPTAG